MIHRIYSSLKTFKTLVFKPGLNVLFAQKEVGASNKQTRNRAGKSSLIELVHFLTGADVGKESLFHNEALINETFGMEFNLGGDKIQVERSGIEKSKLNISGLRNSNAEAKFTNSEWIDMLGDKMFKLNTVRKAANRTPKFRSLFSYFVRRQNSGAFMTPEKQANMQQIGDYQIALMFLMGLDWEIAGDWQQVRDREKTLKELKKALNDGTFGNIIGKASDLRTQLTVAEARLNELKSQVESFRVLPQYRELEAEMDQITIEMNVLSNANTIDTAKIRDLEMALKDEAPPLLTDLEAIYAEAGINLPGVALKRYDEVVSFHESVIRNRRDYLSSELTFSRQNIESRHKQMAKLDHRKSEVMRILKSHGALDQFARLQGELGRFESEVESLHQRFESAEQLESTKNELDIERNRLALRLRRDFSEQKTHLSEAILAFEETSKRLYESAGSMKVDETTNGPIFQFPMQGSRSKGIKNMQIFCFDLMLMQLCSKHNIGPGFLIHDSHLFDGVDGRQVISSLKVGAEMAEEIGFQYLITINEDDAFKETIKGFDIHKHKLPVVLTDATENGGLFGFRF